MPTRHKLRLTIIVIITLAFVSINETKASDYTTVFVVRHAEKDLTFTGTDELKPLTAKGENRAKSLAKILSSENIATVFHTEYKRTKDTGAYTASLFGVATQLYKVNNIVSTIKNVHSGQSVLIVGHSDTVPDILKEFGISSVPKIDDDQFDDLFIVIICNEKDPPLIHLKYSVYNDL